MKLLDSLLQFVIQLLFKCDKNGVPDVESHF